jgi:hypothetical protein
MPSSLPPGEPVTESVRARRRQLPEADRFREQFRQLAEAIYRGSIDPYAENRDGEYLYDYDKVAELLKDEIETLKMSDALIGLMLLKESDKTAEAKKHRKIGCYRLIRPSVKALNGIYFGPSATNEFINALHASIKIVLGRSRASLLQHTFKTGIFEIDASEENCVEEKLSAIPRIASDLLIAHIDRRILKLRERIMEENPEKIAENIAALEDLRKAVSGEHTMDISFGFSEIGESESDLWMAVRNAECAANIAALQYKSGDSEPGLKSAAYSHASMMQVLCGAYLSRMKVLDPDSEEPKILDEWKPFFVIAANTKEVRMNPEMIGYHRNPEKFRKTKLYSKLTAEDGIGFQERRDFFREYYDAVNIIDILKNFTEENYDDYLAKIRDIVWAIGLAETELAKPQHDRKKIGGRLHDIQELLEVSLKDDGEKRTGTTRSMAKRLIGAKNPVLIYGDNIGFGIGNQSSYEKSVFHLVYLLGLKSEDFLMMETHPSAADEVIRAKTEIAETDPQFKTEILKIGDEGTRILRSHEERIAKAVEGNPVRNADGGDEATIILDSITCEIPGDEELERRLRIIGNETRMRIAIVYGLKGFETMPTFDKENGTVEARYRRTIFDFIQARERAEEAHVSLKEIEEAGKEELTDALESGDPDLIAKARRKIATRPVKRIDLRNLK